MKIYQFILTIAIATVTPVSLAKSQIEQREPAKTSSQNAFVFDYVGEFSDGLAMVSINGKEGFINKSGKLVIPVQYNEGDIGFFSEGLAPVKINEKWGFIDKSGKLVIPAQYDDVGLFSEGLAPVKINEKWGFIDKSGKLVIPAQYSAIASKKNIFSDGLAAVSINNRKFGFINKSGKLVIPEQYDNVSYYGFSDGLVKVRINGKWGFINKSGKLVIPAQYDNLSIYSFSEGLSAVQINEKWGFFNTSGKLVIPAQYGRTSSFSNGLAKVHQGFINKSGQLVVSIPDEYSVYPPNKVEGGVFSDGLALVKTWNPSKFGFINTSGKLVIPAQYDKATSFSDGLAQVELNGQKGFIDKSGKWVFKYQSK